MQKTCSDNEIDERLNRMSTHWATVIKAHDQTKDGANSARAEILYRYHEPVFRYLVAAVQDLDAAEEIAQEFAVRFLWGDFHRVNPLRGRFRDYLKKVLVNMVIDHFKEKQRSPKQLSDDAIVPAKSVNSNSSIQEFDQALCHELIQRAWSKLKKDRPKYHHVLRIRSENEELSSRDIAVRLSNELDDPVSAEWVRKAMQRGRARFAKLLITEVRTTLNCSTIDELRRELKDLNLLKHCGDVLKTTSESKFFSDFSLAQDSS